jgi:uncharacterized membrane protein
VVGLVYLFGLAVESRLESRVRRLIDSLMQRIPFVGNLYDVTKRLSPLWTGRTRTASRA